MDNQRPVPVRSRADPALARHLPDAQCRRRARWNRRRAWYFLRPAARRTTSSQLVGAPSTLVTEMTYSHVLPTMQQRAAEKMTQILGMVLPAKAQA